MTKSWQRQIGLVFKLGTIFGAGILSAIAVPPIAYKDATGVLASFAGVVVAAVVPTMILAATILRPVSRGKNEYSEMRGAVSKQLSFFSGLFLLTTALAMILFVGSLLGWSDVKVHIPISMREIKWEFDVPVTRVIGGAAVSLSVLLAIQMTGFVYGIRSLFILHADSAEKELDKLIEEQNEAISTAVLPKDPRKDFGQNLGELKH